MPRTGCFRAALLLAVCLGPVRDLPAMQDDPATRAVASAAAGPHAQELDGFPVPVPPALIARDPSGRTTVRPARITSALRIDGTLDEAIYESIPAISDFVQNDPVEGAPSTEKTEVWIFFDGDNVYVTARCWDSEPGRLIANEMRRDSFNIVQSNDGFGFAFDTFHDGRNSVAFEVSAAGGRIDAQITNERQVNLDWNPVWDVKVGGSPADGRWRRRSRSSRCATAPGREQVWGFNARRIIRWKNEFDLHGPDSGVDDDARPFRGLADADAHGPRSAGGIEKPRDQAVRHLAADDRPGGVAACVERPWRRWRRRCEGRPDGWPHGRPDLPHRLRSGRGRRAAGEPDAIQPVLPREARVLSREPGSVCLRRQHRRQSDRWWRGWWWRWRWERRQRRGEHE